MWLKKMPIPYRPIPFIYDVETVTASNFAMDLQQQYRTCTALLAERYHPPYRDYNGNVWMHSRTIKAAIVKT